MDVFLVIMKGNGSVNGLGLAYRERVGKCDMDQIGVPVQTAVSWDRVNEKQVSLCWSPSSVVTLKSKVQDF
jgi:hypothetical protein